MATSRLIHYHIFKNAGSSVDRLLRESFGSGWSSFEGESVFDIISPTRLQDFLQANPEIIAVSSHMARPPLPSPEARAIAFLRHPIERARSVYNFVRRHDNQWGHSIAINGDFRDYLKWCLDRREEGGVVIRDYQVIHLSEASFRAKTILVAKATSRDLDQAKACLENFSVFGIVSRFSESCQLFSHAYGSLFPQLRMFDVRENASGSRAFDETAGLEIVREEVGDDLYGRFAGANELDVALYEWAKDVFNRNVDQMKQIVPRGQLAKNRTDLGTDL